MNWGQRSIAAVICMVATQTFAQDTAQERPEILREQGKAVVAEGTLMCSSQQALERLQAALYKGDNASEHWLVTSGACTITDSMYTFHDIEIHDKGTLKSVSARKLRSDRHFICRYSYRSSVDKYLAKNQKIPKDLPSSGSGS